MTTAQNKELVLNAYASLNSDNPASYFDYMSDDVRITYFGSHRFSGEYKGKAEVLKVLTPIFRERLNGPLRLHVSSAIAEGDVVIVEASGLAPTKDDGQYNNSYCIVHRIEGAKIVEIREYMDTELVRKVFG
jgi:uncharacterized protein